MRKLRLDNFRVVTLTNMHSVKGGTGGGDIETGPIKVKCVDDSKRFVRERVSSISQ